MLSRLAVVALTLALPTIASADECPWYVSEDNPDAWIEMHEGGRVLWLHIPGSGDMFDVYQVHDILDMVAGNDLRGGLQFDDKGQVRRGIQLDFRTVDGQQAIIAWQHTTGTTVYFRTCSEPMWAPVPQRPT